MLLNNAPLLALLAVLGLIGGGFVNHVVYSWCWFPRPISPWLNEKEQELLKSPRVNKHNWLARVPILGWWTRRGESEFLGRWFWVRPMLIEIALMLALPAYFLFVCEFGGMLPETERTPARLGFYSGNLYWVFFAHAVLIVLMTAATFIDFDEQTIPDLITIPGTLFALFVATLQLAIFMPGLATNANGVEVGYGPIMFGMPVMPSDPKWFGRPGLVAATSIWTVWCFALANRRVIMRKGFAKAVEFFLAGLFRYPSWKFLLAMWIFGLPAIVSVWSISGPWWLGLFTSLVGLAVGGGIVWAVRIVASAAMGVEAMGFGDVTLMAMIGAFIGWQASLAAFFLSPIAAVAIVLIQYVITRESRVPFGPYLCVGTALTCLFWDPIYNDYLASTLRVMGPVLLWFGIAMFGGLGVMLFVWNLIKKAVFV